MTENSKAKKENTVAWGESEFFYCVLQLDLWGSPFWVTFLRK